MSVGLTEQAVVDRRKTVTRRRGWRFLRPGDRLTLVRKSQGRWHPDGVEPLVRLCDVEVIRLDREPLTAITSADIARECVPVDRFESLEATEYGWQPSPAEWARWYADEMGLSVRAQSEFEAIMVTRIEWRYWSKGDRG